MMRSFGGKDLRRAATQADVISRFASMVRIKWDPRDRAIEGMVAYLMIEGDPGYRVGSDGSAWSCLNPGGKGRRRMLDRWRRLKEHPAKGGYLRVRLRTGMRMVHHLVLEAFVGPCPPGMQGCHNDGDPTNNRPENLRWDTPKANMADRARHGREVRGSRKSSAKLDEGQIPEIRRLKQQGMGDRKLARLYGVAPSTIYYITSGRNWHHVET
jgi:hypothetical protein